METLSSISRLKEQLDETGDLSFCSAVKSYMSDKQGVLDRSPSSIASPAAVTTTRGISETVELQNVDKCSKKFKGIQIYEWGRP